MRESGAVSANAVVSSGPSRSQARELALALLMIVGCGGGGGSGSIGGTSPASTLNASPPGVAPGGTTTLSWTAANVTTCTASGAWSGARNLSGREATPPITRDQTYSLSCNGPNGGTLSMITVSVRTAALRWTKPTTNVDGSALVDLAGYKVYWGPASREYSFSATVNGPDSTAHTVTLDRGTWFFALTAINSSGEESSKTNEVSKTVY